MGIHGKGNEFVTIAEKSWPPSHAPPPGLTDCSMMATRTEGSLLSS